MNKVIAVGNAASGIVSSMKNLVPNENYLLLNREVIVTTGGRLKNDLLKFLGESKIVIMAVCLGGEMGSKYLSRILSILNVLGLKVLLITQMPFTFEGRRRNETALKALRLLEKKAYNLVVIFGQEVIEKHKRSGLTLEEAFSLLDKEMIKTISNLTVP
jgi:cell division GTPase FtsZ